MKKVLREVRRVYNRMNDEGEIDWGEFGKMIGALCEADYPETARMCNELSHEDHEIMQFILRFLEAEAQRKEWKAQALKFADR